MRHFCARLRRMLAALLICAMAFAAIPAFAQNRLLIEYQQAHDALLALYTKEKVFVYNGKEYPLAQGISIANSVFWQTEDYYPFCDALLAENLKVSAEMGALFLNYIDVLNRVARRNGYTNYKECAEKSLYYYTFNTSAVPDILRKNYPRSMSLLLSFSYYREYVHAQAELPIQAYIDGLIERYGQISPDFVSPLTELVASPRFFLEKVDEAHKGGRVSHENGEVSLHIEYNSDSFLASALAHEMGHYLHNAQMAFWNEPLVFSETHSISGSLLCADYAQAQFEALMGEQWAAMYMIQYLSAQLISLYAGAAQYELVTDILLHRNDYTPEKIAEKYLEVSLSFGYDGGYSPAYQMLVGCDWYQDAVFLDTPMYTLSYAIGACNALALWRDQTVNGTGETTYARLIHSETPIDEPYSDACRRLGLIDFFAPGAHDGLDDFLAEKLLEYERIAFGES